ncbi:Aste57867_21853 [Aphanomyces stellatus]|uniref:Aste57867_21853 protein n=1 Tax=Aphanomyces stellatus TaxID=120398 RepID=A0A485LIL6_9STRA|nr:hypothetical protein As57867_021784 [Aphanomyces stellatus]VFT98522.1 Aste57867_21853 [Aphanomyces stellatus]
MKRTKVFPVDALHDIDQDEDEVEGFISTIPATATFTPRSEWNDIDAKLNQTLAVNLRDPKARLSDLRNEEDEDDDVVDGFVSESPDFIQMNLEKKLERYATQLKEMKSRMDKWHTRRTAYQEYIKQLETRLKEQEESFAEQEAAWEKEALTMSQSIHHPQHAKFQNVGAIDFAGREQLERQKAKEAMRQMLHGAADMDQDEIEDSDDNPRKTHRQRFLVLLRRLSPLVHDIKQIQARFGTSVSAYFVFNRWIILNYLLLLVPTIYISVVHIHELIETKYSAWGRFVDILPSFLTYQSYTTDEALYYSIYLVAVCAVFFMASTQKWLQEDRVSKLVQASDEQRHYKFGKLLLNAWDFETTSRQDASDLRQGIGEALNVALYDNVKQELIRNRTKRERYKLYARRTLATLVYIVIQSTCWALIILLTVFSSKLQQTISENLPVLTNYAASIVPLGAAIINGALPAIISILTKFERWDDQGFEIKAMVTRLFLAKVLNILIQLWSYGMLLDPYMYTQDKAPLDWMPLPSSVRGSVMIKFNSTRYSCRAEQVTSGLMILVLTDFFVSKASAVVVAGVKIALEKFKHWYGKRKNKVVPASDTRAEFLIAPKMVALMYSCTLYQFTIPLAPMTAFTSLLMLLASFKFDKFYLQKFQKKPVAPWSAKDAGTFFIKLYWTTVLIFLGCMFWFLNDTTLPKQCEIQEANLTAPLCETSTWNTTTNVCAISTTAGRSMSAYFAGQVRAKAANSECSKGYPACICAGSLACGPFAASYSGYAPLANALSTYEGIKTIYDLAANEMIFGWVLVGLLLMQVMLKSNSLKAIELVSMMKDQDSKGQISSLLKKLKAQEKKLKLQKLQT